MKKEKVIDMLERWREVSMLSYADSDVIDEINDAIKFVQGLPELTLTIAGCGTTGHTGCQKCHL